MPVGKSHFPDRSAPAPVATPVHSGNLLSSPWIAHKRMPVKEPDEGTLQSAATFLLRWHSYATHTGLSPTSCAVRHPPDAPGERAPVEPPPGHIAAPRTLS